MFLAAVGEPACAVLCLAWDQAVRSVGDRAPVLASAVVLMSVSAAVGLFAKNLIEHKMEVLSRVLFTAVRVPALAFLGLSWNLTVSSVGNSSVESSSAVVLDSLGSGDDVAEVLCQVLLASVRVPALTLSIGLSRNLSVFGVSNSAPELAGTIALLALSRVDLVVENGGSASLITNESEVVGVVLLAAVRVPAVVSLGLARNAAVRGLCDCAPESSSAIVLETLRTGADSLKHLSFCVFIRAAVTVGAVTVHM